MTSEPVNVICMKWGRKYGSDYVNILCAMVRRHLSREHRFICLTDDRAGVHEDIECMDLPAGLPDALYPSDERRGENDLRGACPSERGWLKMSLHRRTIGDLRGRTLYLDLDTVLVDNIDPIVDHPGRFCISHDWTWRRRRPAVGNSSVMCFDIGANAAIFDMFVRNWREITATYRNDQWFVSEHITGKTFLPESWCISFKRHCVPRFPRNFMQAPHLPAGARIVIFHGRPDPPGAIAGRSGKWHRHLKPAPWILNHWRE